MRRGFVYKRVPHVTLKSIANNPDIREGMTREEIDAAIARHADSETLYDQPYEDPKVVRVTGPFTVESLSPHRVLSTADDDWDGSVSEQEAQQEQDFATMILENLRKAGVQNTYKGERIVFDRLDPFPGKAIVARGEFTDANGENRTVAVTIGPEHGTVGKEQIRDAAKEAMKGAGVDVLLVCGFAFDGSVSEEAKQYGALTVLPTRMNPDLTMDELLKKTGAGNLFMVFGEPDLEIRETGDSLVVEVRDKKRAEAVFDLGPFVILPRPVVPEVVSGLAGAMRDANPRVRLDATYALGVLARPPADSVATDALVAALHDPDGKVREAAARVAGPPPGPRAADALFDAVNDRQAPVKAAAMRALGDLRDARAVQALTDQLQFYGKGGLALAALDALARIAHPSSVPVFQAQLAGKGATMRRAAAEGLARSGQASLSLPTLESGSADRDRAVALAVAYALQSAGRPSLDRLVTALGDPKLQSQAMLYLTELGRPVARALGGYLQSPDPVVRQAVAMVLGVIGGDDALAALERAKADPDTEVARAAERAIARVRTR